MKWLTAMMLVMTFGCAHKPVKIRPSSTDTQRLIERNVLFHTGEVNLKESTVVIEPLLPPSFVAYWFDGDLKRQPVEKMLLNCDVYEVEHEGGKYTKLACPELGDVFVREVRFGH